MNAVHEDRCAHLQRRRSYFAADILVANTQLSKSG